MFMIFGGALPLYAIILIPIAITFIYEYKTKLLELSRNGIIFLLIFVMK